MPSVVMLGEPPPEAPAPKAPKAKKAKRAPRTDLPPCVNYRCAYNARAKRWVKVCSVQDARYPSGTMLLPDRTGDCLPKREASMNGSGRRR